MRATAEPLDTTLTAGIGFLDRARSDDELWSDFQTLAGSSTEWVSAFVLYSLRRRRPEPDPLALRALWRGQRPSGGWAYNGEVPPDCDSTAWVLLALGCRYLRPSAVLRAQSYLLRHQDAGTGGFATYTPEDCIDRYIGADAFMVHGWTSPHGCVTAVAVQALLATGASRRHPSAVDRAVEYLLRREDDGAWRSHWWTGMAYGTYHALRALALSRRLTPAVADRAKRRLVATQHADGGWSPRGSGSGETFETAFSALALMLVASPEDGDAARTAAAWLISRQCADGSWPAKPILQIPSPPERDPAPEDAWREDALGTGVRLRDGSRVFTSAAAVCCLLTFSQHGLACRTGSSGRVELLGALPKDPNQ